MSGAILRLCRCWSERRCEPDRLRSLDFNLDEGGRMRGAVHHIMLDARRTMIRLTCDKSGLGNLGAVVNAQGEVGEHDDEIRPTMRVPAGNGSGWEVPTGDANVLVVLLDSGHGRDRADEGHRAAPLARVSGNVSSAISPGRGNAVALF